MTLKVKICENTVSKVTDGTQIHFSWPNLAKIGYWKLAEKLSGFDDKKTPACASVVRAPILHPIG